MNHSRKVDLRSIAKQAMLDRGFIVGISPEAQRQLAAETEPRFEKLKIRDLSSWLWSSIDNDDSRDLDQIEYATTEERGFRFWVGVADVDWFVPRDSPLDRSAQQNTTSVYTGVETFPMLPERLSTDLSSLNESGKRLAMVVEIAVDGEGAILESRVFNAIVENKAQLTYEAVAAWLDQSARPEEISNTQSVEGRQTLAKISESPELQEQLRLQDRIASLLRDRRHDAGALNFETIELRPIMSNGTVVELKEHQRNRAGLIIEDFMIAVNREAAQFLDQKGLPSVRRVVQEPRRWDRIVALAASLGATLPGVPDSKSLAEFLREQNTKDPEHFPDLSFSVIKLLGRGEYVVKAPGEEAPGHFGLAVEDYAHSTAPNRRYPDILTQRLLKAAVSGSPSPYSTEQLESLARHCTARENDANKVERFVRKCAAATLLSSHIGQTFDAIVAGTNPDGTWVRLSRPPVEGKLDEKGRQPDVGQRVRVRLVSTNPEKGFIDFELMK